MADGRGGADIEGRLAVRMNHETGAVEQLVAQLMNAAEREQPTAARGRRVSPAATWKMRMRLKASTLSSCQAELAAYWNSSLRFRATLTAAAPRS